MTASDDPWSTSDAYQALASHVNRLARKEPALVAAFDHFTQMVPRFTAMIRDQARREARDERARATAAPPDAPWEDAPPPAEEDRKAAAIRDEWLSVKWTPNARANIPPWSLTVASEKRAWRCVEKLVNDAVQDERTECEHLAAAAGTPGCDVIAARIRARGAPF